MKPLIVANWKMNPQTLAEAKKLFDLVKMGTKNIKKAEVVICPPFLYLKELSSFKKRSLAPLKIGAQNCFWEQKGAFTGEISSVMLKDIGCQYVLVGHSERRRYFSETDEVVSRKLKSVIEAGMSPILCIGETQDQRDREETENILRKQIEGALRDISKATLRGVSRFARSSKIQNSPKQSLRLATGQAKLCIAYEPIWAIGTGNPCDVEEAQKMGLLIRKIISKIYNQALSKKIRILYGGSVDSKNAAGYIKEANLQGLLVGGASLKAKEFVRIVKSSI